MTVQTIIFDLDGTLLDTLGDLTDSVNAMLSAGGYPLQSAEQVRALLGHGISTLVREALPRESSEAEIASALAFFNGYYAQHQNSRTKPYAGILPLLERLSAQGITLAVVSNKYDQAVQALCQAHFGALIQLAVGERPGFARKPAPDNVLWVMAQLAADSTNTLYVGDSEVDIQTAKNAGLPVVAVTWGFRDRRQLMAEAPDYLIDDPRALLVVLTKKGEMHEPMDCGSGEHQQQY